MPCSQAYRQRFRGLRKKVEQRPTLNLLGVKERYSQSGFTPGRQSTRECSSGHRLRDFDPFPGEFTKDRRWYLSSGMQGTVEVDGVETLLTILTDSGCLKLIKEGVVAARKATTVVWDCPRVKVASSFGIANVACVHELPVAGVDLILSNDLAGGQMGERNPTSCAGRDQSLPQAAT
ncbi:hypothetical protein Hamer_G001577, partial [Homarus americanus]